MFGAGGKFGQGAGQRGAGQAGTHWNAGQCGADSDAGIAGHPAAGLASCQSPQQRRRYSSLAQLDSWTFHLHFQQGWRAEGQVVVGWLSAPPWLPQAAVQDPGPWLDPGVSQGSYRELADHKLGPHSQHSCSIHQLSEKMHCLQAGNEPYSVPRQTHSARLPLDDPMYGSFLPHAVSA